MNFAFHRLIRICLLEGLNPLFLYSCSALALFIHDWMPLIILAVVCSVFDALHSRSGIN